MAGVPAELAEDWGCQVDEVQALEAIFAHDFRVLDATGIAAADSSGKGAQLQQQGLDAAALPLLAPPHCCAPDNPPGGSGSGTWALDCSLLVHVEPPAGTLRLVLAERPSSGSSGGGEAGGGGDDGPSTSGRGSGGYRMQHLPPICMQVRLTGGYPSARPPEVALSALWLSAQQAAALEAQLAALWHEQGPGMPVCYVWADWLQSSALQHLGAAEALRLEGAPSGGGADDGASTAGDDVAGSPEDRLLKLMRFNAVREHQLFLESEHTCGVCLEEQRGAAFVRLDCRHAWCRGCLGEQARIHVAEGGLDRLRCPYPKCGAPLAPGVLQRLLSAEEYARWEQLALQRMLDSMPDAAYCPRCGTLSLEDDDSCAQCSKCLYVFCSLCNEGWHPGTQCVSAETKLAMLRRKMEGGSRAALEDLRRQEQDLMSVARIEKTAKKCPRCGMATEKAEGCNKMSCGGCGAFWCWRCGKAIDGYRHFRSGDCVLFDEAEILRWEAQWEEMQAAARVAAAGMRNEFVGQTAARQGRLVRGCFCPQCGQVNHKLGNNNHMTCWSCTSPFCYQCRAVLRGRGAGGAHFGARGCKQHSAD